MAWEATDRMLEWSWENPLRRVFYCLRKSQAGFEAYGRAFALLILTGVRFDLGYTFLTSLESGL